MAKQRSTVAAFIANGKTLGANVSMEFEGFSTRGDEGNGLRFYKTGSTGSPSETPTERNDNSFTDSEGYVYTLMLGQTISYNGSNNWFPGFGSSGIGVYTLTSDGWATVGIEGVDTVVNVIGLVSPANSEPDVYIPFNDSLEIVRGYGTHDQIDVSAAQDGSVMVDLPSKSVDFSRASGRTVINKSGELVTLGVDEPAISSDGLGVCGEYTNKLYWSEDVTNSAWLKTVGASVVNDGEKGSDGVTPMYLCSVDNTKQDPRISQIGAIQTQGSSAVFSVVVKKATSDTVALLVASITGGIMVSQPLSFNFATEQFESISPQLDFTKVVKLANGCYQLFMGITDNSSGNTTWRMDVIRKNGATGISDVYASQAMIVEGVSLPVPYIKTESTPVTSSPDVASIPMRNNMPAAGKPFTIMLDLPDYPSESGTPWRVNTSPTPKKLYLGRGAPNAYYFFLAESPLLGTGGLGSTVDAPHKVAVRFDGANMAIFINGDKKNEQAATPPFEWNIDDTIKFHANHDATIKNFEIYHRALTDDEIKAKGAAK